MARPMNMERRIRAALSATPTRGSNPVARAMIIQSRGGRHVDRKKEASRRACRGVDRRDRGCCPGHDKFPGDSYANRRSKKARARSKTVAHKRARARARAALQAETVPCSV